MNYSYFSRIYTSKVLFTAFFRVSTLRYASLSSQIFFEYGVAQFIRLTTPLDFILLNALAN